METSTKKCRLEIIGNITRIIDDKDNILVDTSQIPQNVIDAIINNSLRDGDTVFVEMQ